MFIFKGMDLCAKKKWATQPYLVLDTETPSAEYK